MRRVVETGFARLAAQRRARPGLVAMEKAVERHACVPSTIPAGFTEADVLFHLGIALATGNTMIRVQMEGMRSVQREVSELFSRRASRTGADWLATVDRHQDVLRRDCGGDAELAEQWVVIHFDAADIASLEVADRLVASPDDAG